MKQITMLLASAVLLFTACNQSNTTPTTPSANPCGISTNSNEYIELKINGATLRSESISMNGAVIFPVIAAFMTDTNSSGDRRIQLLGSSTTCSINSTMINSMAININVSKLLNHLDPIGTYNKQGYGSFDYYKSISDKKSYDIPDDSITVTVTSCTADYVSGTFSGTAIENNTLISYPITGSFNNLKRSGF